MRGHRENPPKKEGDAYLRIRCQKSLLKRGHVQAGLNPISFRALVLQAVEREIDRLENEELNSMIFGSSQTLTDVEKTRKDPIR